MGAGQFGDKEKAARTWDAVVSLSEKDADQHVWYLLASERRALHAKADPDAGLTTRRQLMTKHLADLDEAETAAKAGGETVKWIGVRVLARDVIELYDDEPDAAVAAGVKKARGVLDAAKGK